jgi:hypothetical protein
MNAKNKPNGHSALPAKGGSANGTTLLSSGLGRAASVDASDLSVANATASSAAAGAEREACADVAAPQGEGRRHQSAGAASRLHKDGKNEKDKEASQARHRRKVVPGREPLPIDGEAFVDAVHAQVDLVQLEVDLLRSKDDKIAQRELAYLRELRYGKRAPVADDDAPPTIIFDAPRPERDLP